MLTLLLAAAAATTPPAFSKDPDTRCMAAYLVASGEAQDDASVSAEDKAGFQSIVMYFMGKLDAKRPGEDLRSEIMNLVRMPGYNALLTADIERCSAEAEARGKYLASFGEAADAAAEPVAPKP